LVHLQIDTKSLVSTVTISRPEKRNALNADLVTGLTDMFVSLSDDESCRVIVLSGTGNTFSAGADLQALEAMQSASFEENAEDSRALANLFRAIRTCRKPVIARVNGHAIAGGLGLLLACDYAVVVSEARLGFPETRIGMVPALVAVLLRERTGALVQRDILLSGRLFSADEALRYGLISSVASPETLDDMVTELALELVHNTSSQAVGATKMLLHDISSLAFDDALEYAILANAKARESEDCRAGISAFLARTDPPWKVRS